MPPRTVLERVCFDLLADGLVEELNGDGGLGALSEEEQTRYLLDQSALCADQLGRLIETFKADGLEPVDLWRRRLIH